MYKTKPRKIARLVLDASGSMMGCRSATIEGYNGYLQSLRAQATECELFVGITIFSDPGKISIGPTVPISEMTELTETKCVTNGSTALNDAVMKSISQMEADAQRLGAESFLLCILTDGDENASVEFRNKGNATVIEAIKARQERNWAVTFMGADMSKQQAVALAETLGVGTGNAMGYDKCSTKEVFGHTARVTASYLNSGERTTKSFFGPNESEEDEPALATVSGTSSKLSGS